jgi:glucose-6-phosphate-specific signal transduction histidine kinase
MERGNVSIVLQLADRTRKAHLTMPRTMRVSDIVKASRGRWTLSFGVDYQIVNLNTNRQLSPHDMLTTDVVANGDVLMLQPFPTHGAG